MKADDHRLRALGTGGAIAALTLLALLALPAWAATVDIEMGDNFFRPDTITIQPGDTVQWSYRGTVQHNVVAADQSWSSGDFNQTGLITDTYSRTFTEPGTHRYVCTYHGACEQNRDGPCFGDMWGTIIVAGDDPDPEPTEPDPDPTEPDPDPTEPDSQPTQSEPATPEPDPTATDATDDPSPPETSPGPDPTSDQVLDPVPTPTPSETPGTIGVADLEGDSASSSRVPLLALATLLVVLGGAGHLLRRRRA